ncbi:hypothetical protein Tco_0268350 [Tanacetum coccineum]
MSKVKRFQKYIGYSTQDFKDKIICYLNDIEKGIDARASHKEVLQIKEKDVNERREKERHMIELEMLKLEKMTQKGECSNTGNAQRAKQSKKNGFHRPFSSLFGEDIEYFAPRLFFNMDKLEKQLNAEEFNEEIAMVVFKPTWNHNEKAITERGLYKRAHDNRVHERTMQTHEGMISKDASEIDNNVAGASHDKDNITETILLYGGDDGDDDDGDSSGDDANDEDADDEDEEEEEHLAPADSTTVIPVDEHVFPPERTEPVIPPPLRQTLLLGLGLPSDPKLTISLPPEAEIASTQALIDAVTAALPPPPLPPSLYIPLPVDRRDDIPESEQPPRKSLYLSTLGSRYRVRLSGYGIRGTWVDPAEAVPEIAPMTVGEVNTRVTELAELYEHDTQDLYALLEDAQDSRSRISQRAI